MKRMRVVAQVSPIEAALFELHKVLDQFFKQKENIIYGTLYLHDGSTDMGYKAPWGEYEEEIDVEVNVKFTHDGDDSFIEILFGRSGIGGIYGAQSDDGNIEFIIDIGSDEETVGTSAIPLEAVAKNVYDKIEESDLPDEHAVDRAQDAYDSAQEDKWDSRRDDY